MKDILKSLNTKLTADDTLKTHLGYDASTHNIRNFAQLKDYNFDRYLLFGKIELAKNDGLTTSKIREGIFQIQAIDRKDPQKVDDILERVIAILDNTDLSESGSFRSLRCEWENSIPTFFDNDTNFYIGTANFNLIVVDLT